MKSFVKYFVPVAVAAIALVACQKEIQVPSEPETVHITVRASAQPLANESTKTYINGSNAVLWGTGEYMKIAVADGSANPKFATSAASSADAFNGDTEALFEFSITPDQADNYTYMGLYPASAAVGTDSDNKNPASYKVKLPDIQNATATSYDPAAYIMVAQAESFNSVQTDWEASFLRATALNKITLKNIPSGVSIKMVKITAPTGKYLAGARHINLTEDGSLDRSSVMLDIYNGGGRTETVEVKFADPLAGGSNIDVWFTSWDVVVAEGEDIVIEAYTTDKKCYSKTITARSTGIKFQEGYLNTLGINMSGITPTDATELEADNYLILAKDGEKYYALKAETAGSNNDKISAVEYTGSTVSYNGDANLIWSVAKSGSSYIISNDSKVIGWTSGNVALWQSASDFSGDSNYLIDIVWDSSNSCYTASLNSDSNRKFQKNSSSDFFAFYTSAQKDQLFFVPATVDKRTAVTLSFAEDAINKTTANYSEFTGQTATATPSVSGITYAMAGDNIGTITEATGAVVLNGNTGTATVTASFAGDATYRPATASYTINVSNASGPQYNLVSTVADVVEGDYIITWDNTYYLPSGSESGSNPAVGTGITVTGGKITNTVSSDMVWHFSGNNTNGFTISNGTNILHSTNTAQGISITTNSTRKWTVSVDGTYGMLLHGDDGGTRNLAVYNSATWRYYSTGNSYTGTLRLYKLTDARDSAPISWPATTGTATMSSSGVSYSLPTLANANSLTVSYSSDNESVATIDNNGAVTAVGAGEAVISATYDGSDSNAPYKTTTVSYTLTVTDNRTACATPSFSPAAGEVTSGSTITISSATEGASIYYTTGTSDFSAGDWTAYTEPIAITSACTIKAIAVKSNFINSEVSSAAYTITVPTVGSGTEADPYTAGDILDKYPSGSGDTEVYVTGTITNIQEVSTSFGNATYTISDGSRNILVYRGKYIGNVSFTSEDQIALNDIVVVFGKIGVYKETPQLAQDNYLISITKDPTTPTISVSPASLSWEATEYDSANAKSIEVTLNGAASAGYYDISGSNSDWTVTKNGNTITVYPKAENSSTTDAKSITLLIAHTGDSSVYREVTCTQAKASGGNPEPIELTFSLTSNPGGWPTANESSLTDYTYTLNNVSYTFQLKNIKQNSGYLMCTYVAVMGLPAIKDYVLSSVVAHNSSSCSTSTRVGISSSSSSASYISGGAYQTWSSTDSNYTYTLSGTSANTVYYLYITNKNAQITSLTLTYTPSN